MTAAWRVARGLALSKQPQHRWRQFSLAVGGFFAALAVLAGLGVTHAGMIAGAHAQSRHPAVAEQPGDVVRLHLSARAVVLPDVGQVPVVWLEPKEGHQGSTEVIPPGLDALPAPGEAVLSPGLLARGISAEDLGFVSAQQQTIHDAGLISRSEGFIYARPALDRTLGEEGAVIPLVGYVPSQAAVPLETITDVPLILGAVSGAAWMLWVPALYLLAGSARAQSMVREERARVLWSLGVAPRAIRAVVALETILVTAAGALPALLLWQGWGRHLTELPLNDAVLLPGAMRTPWWWSVLAALIVCGAAALLALTQPVLPRPLKQRLRRGNRWGLVPFGLAVLLMGLSPLALGPTGLWLLFAGLFLTLLSLPLAVPSLTRFVTPQLSRLDHPSVWLAGRRLALRTRTLTRPAVVVAALVFVAGSAYALLAGMGQGVIEPMSGERNVWTVSWRDPQAGDFEIIQSRAPQDVAVAALQPLREDPVGEEMPESMGTLYFDGCAEVTQTLGSGTACTQGSKAFGYDIVSAIPKTDPVEPFYQVLISAPRTWTELDLLPLFEGFPAPNASQLQGDSEFMHPGVDWMSTGWAAATLLLILAMAREIGDRSRSAVREDDVLVRAGLSPREAARTSGTAVLLPVLVALPLGYFAALVFALRGFGLGITAFNFGLISAVALAAALTSLAMIAGPVLWRGYNDR